jgi:SAM-dependent methyltransferase
MIFQYPKYRLWRGIIERLIPKNSSYRVLEIGCAPGDNLLIAEKIMGYQPYGVEYTDEGCKVTRQNFFNHGLNSDNIINADFFSDSFLNEYEKKFDIVMSFGFVEHFQEPEKVIERHLKLIKPGGYLVLNIPRFVGMNYYLVRFFCPSALKKHNLEIMEKSKFAGLFGNKRLCPLYCDYYGVFYFGLVYATSKPKELLLILLKSWQVVLNVLFFLIGAVNEINYPWLSPYLLYVGKYRE